MHERTRLPTNSNPAVFALRHSIAPYRTLGTAFILFAIWGFIDSYHSKNWGFFESTLLLIGMYSLQVMMGLWYRIVLKNDVIIQRAFGKKDVSLQIKNITSVGNEVSGIKTNSVLNRPFRRVTIYGNSCDGNKYIDISLKHFVEEDIRSLIQIIHEKRPDLVVPKKYAQTERKN
ncbi:MAG: hypothetical protein ABUS47_12735 [Steroidobacter sp.]